MKPIMLLAPFALAACNSGSTVTATNASGNEVAAKVAAAGADGGMPAPGRWEGAMTFEDMKMPGMDRLPPEALAQVKASMMKPRSFTSCLTPEEARAPKQGFFGADPDCKYDSFKMGGGKIDAVMTCADKGTARKTVMTGTYAPESYAMSVSSTGSAPGMGDMSMRMRLEAKHAGACTGKEG